MAVWSETRVAFADDQAFEQAMCKLGVAYSAPTQAAASLAGAICKKYRAGAGPRDRVIADFLIGAHAAAQCDRLLTRDRGYYRKHFSGLVIVDPAA